MDMIHIALIFKGTSIKTINPLFLGETRRIVHLVYRCMEMKELVAREENLCEQSEKLLQEVKYWSWSELIAALKNSQDILLEPSLLDLLHKLLDSMVARIDSLHETSPLSTSSPDSLSSDARSSESLRNGGAFKATWWFEDLAELNIHVIEMLVRMMATRDLTSQIVGKFLLYYQKARFELALLQSEKVEVLEGVVAMLCSLDFQCVPYKGLFKLLRIALNLEVDEVCREKLRSMIGSGLDEASVDNLLLPWRGRRRKRKNCMFDVNLVLSFLRSFLGKGIGCLSLDRVKKVGNLIDLYLVEIAPDRCLKPSKFLATMKALPDCARDSFDGVYRAVNLYLEVHKGLSEEQKMKVCSGLNYEKLSSEPINDLTQNPNFPPKFAAKVLTSQQCKLKSLLQDTGRAIPTHITTHPGLILSESHKGSTASQVILYTKKFYLSNDNNDNDKLKSHLQGMQSRAMELENICLRMQVQMAKMMKSRLLPSHENIKFVP